MDAPGTLHRNHCPSCLWSRHLDDTPGDRDADCGASMEPIAICVRADGEWALVHRCGGCSAVSVNRVAGDDNPLALMRIAVRPLARPPFPLETLRVAGVDMASSLPVESTMALFERRLSELEKLL